MEDTICAIATASGVGAISIIKVSGNKAISIVNSLFSKNLNKAKSHTINYGYILDNKQKIDEVLITIMKSPKTFTKEDIVEINCHGGISVTNKILNLLLEKGCRLAEPGEFTKRAYLNGRIDLIEAEAISDIITAETDNASKLAINQIDGKLSIIIKEIRQKLLGIQANIEVNIDYPEYEDIEVVTNNSIKNKIIEIKSAIQKLADTSTDGKIIKNGIDIAIIGKPNVGKSSILNFLLNEDKAIVTDIAGTTRDVIEGKTVINGILINFYDTAGIRETEDKVEKIGVNKSINILNKSDLVIFVLDNSLNLSVDDLDIIEMLKNKKFIIFINKSDLSQKIDINLINKYEVIEGNTVNNNGLDNLKNKIIEMFNLEKIINKDMTYLSNARQVHLINEALKSINNVLEAINKNVPIDVIGIDITKTWEILGELIGESYKEELLDELFSKFCLGK